MTVPISSTMPMKRDTGVEGREVRGRKARRGLNLREVRWEVLWVVAREKVPIVHNSWKDVPDTLKELVWNEILVSAVLVTYKV